MVVAKSKLWRVPFHRVLETIPTNCGDKIMHMKAKPLSTDHHHMLGRASCQPAHLNNKLCAVIL
jgi:hypothetical protein